MPIYFQAWTNQCIITGISGDATVLQGNSPPLLYKRLSYSHHSLRILSPLPKLVFFNGFPSHHPKRSWEFLGTVIPDSTNRTYLIWILRELFESSPLRPPRRFLRGFATPWHWAPASFRWANKTQAVRAAGDWREIWGWVSDPPKKLWCNGYLITILGKLVGNSATSCDFFWGWLSDVRVLKVVGHLKSRG